MTWASWAPVTKWGVYSGRVFSGNRGEGSNRPATFRDSPNRSNSWATRASGIDREGSSREATHPSTKVRSAGARSSISAAVARMDSRRFPTALETAFPTQ